MFRLLLPFCLVLSACAGGPDAAALQADVDAKIAARDYSGAVAKADEALRVPAFAGNPAMAWRLESARLGALAAGGKGAEVKAALERLAGPYPAQITSAQYLALADKVRAAGDGAGYADLLDAGLKKFPEEPAFAAKIEQMKSSPDPEEIERLKALGYL